MQYDANIQNFMVWEPFILGVGARTYIHTNGQYDQLWWSWFKDTQNGYFCKKVRNVKIFREQFFLISHKKVKTLQKQSDISDIIKFTKKWKKECINHASNRVKKLPEIYIQYIRQLLGRPPKIRIEKYIKGGTIT